MEEEEETATPNYCFAGAGTLLAGVAFTVFLAVFLACFLVDFVAAGAGLVEAGAGVGAGAGVWAKVRLARPSVRLRIVVFIGVVS